MSKKDECVRVMVRIRPMSQKERQDGRKESTTANFERAEVSIINPTAGATEPPKSFTFDAAFGANSTQQQVYDTAATEIVEAVMEGYNGTIFAYGQTGAGKSHTMEGYGDQPGIIPNTFKHIFDKVAISKNKRIMVRASYLEIYNEEIRDLLGKDPKQRLELKENADTGVFVKGLTPHIVKDTAEIDHVMQQGKKNRSVGQTLMNQTSSRSHSIFTIVVECLSESGSDGKGHICVGKLNLVDLAGSERQSKTGATGERLQEANKINLSLSALGNVISALVDGKSKHIPYRDSKLTRLLQDSLGGNTKTVMIANCGPADYNYEETLTTLRYASRAKNIKNKPKINEDPKDAMIREFQEEIEALKAKLVSISAAGVATSTLDPQNLVSGESEVVERVVEKIVIEKGISEEEARVIAAKQQKEREDVVKETQNEIALAQKDKAIAEHNKRALEMKLELEAQQAKEMEEQKRSLMEKISSLQEKVLIGGEMMTKAAQQEDELRRAKLELEERKRQELKLARELAEKEEKNLMREESYQSLQEEAEAKTRKLKKVYNKVKEVLGDIKAMEKAYGREREDLIDTIRQLTQQLKLKSMIVNYFIPNDMLAILEKRAQWNDEEDDYTLDHLEIAGNSLRPRQKAPSASAQRRPESSAGLDKSGSKKNLDTDLNLHKDEDGDIFEQEIETVRNPYFVYIDDPESEGYAHAASVPSTKKKRAIGASRTGNSSSGRPKTARKGSSSKRPETARHRNEGQ